MRAGDKTRGSRKVSVIPTVIAIIMVRVRRIYSIGLRPPGGWVRAAMVQSARLLPSCQALRNCVFCNMKNKKSCRKTTGKRAVHRYHLLIGGIDGEPCDYYEKTVFRGVSSCEINKENCEITNNVGFFLLASTHSLTEICIFYLKP